MYKKIKDLRERHNLTQAQVARVLKTTQQQYSKIENGISDISGEKLILLANYYHVSADYILGLETGSVHDAPEKSVAFRSRTIYNK